MQSFVGLGFGATSVALFTDYVFRNEKMLGYSMSVVLLIVLPLTSLVLWYCLARYRMAAATTGLACGLESLESADQDPKT